MKAKFLKIAGVKSEKEFYKKYPTEAAFFKAHPEAKELKKAYGGWDSLALTVSQALNKKGSENPFQNPFAKDNLQATTAAIPGTVGGVQSVKDARKRTADLKTMANVSDIQLKAAMTTPEPIRKRINRPEMYASRPGQLFPSQGTGYDAAFAVGKHGTTLKAEDGMQIGGNLTEIQNMYNPGDLYSDLGYEPLSESDIVKQYADGGLVPKAAQGFDANMAGTIGTGFINAFAGASPESNLGGQIGGLFGPLGGFVGTAIGKAFGAKREGEEAFATGNLQRNMGQIQGIQQIRGIHSQNSSVMNNGGNVPQAEVGWVSHDWQPQKIAYFGEHSMKDLLKADPTMDTLRTGGNLRQNNMSEMDQFNFGGNLKTHWGGRAEVDSYNPYLPGTGETVMFKGNQHSESDGKGRTGIGVSYGPQEHDSYTDYAEYGTEQAADVEVENGEPAIQLPESPIESPMKSFALGGQQNTNDLSMTVFGAIKVNKDAARQIGDPNAEGLTYKNLVKGYNKKENKLNKKLDKANEELADLQVNTPFDRLKLNSLQSTIQGADQELRKLAAFKINAAGVQNDQNEIADKYGLDVNALAKGEIKPSKDMGNAKYGTKKAQTGVDYTGPSIVDYLIKAGKPSDFKTRKKLVEELGIKNYNKSATKNTELLNALRKRESATAESSKTPLVLQSAQNAPVDPKDPLGLTRIFPEQEDSYVMPPLSRESYETGLKDVAKGFKNYRERKAVDAGMKADRPTATVKREASQPGTPKSKTDIGELAKILAGQLPALLRKPYSEEFDYAQTLKERAALAMNQLEPVDVQLLQPLLTQPFQVSLDDQKAQIKSSYANARRLTGNNPAAQAMIAAKESEDLNKINAEEFRLNQGIMAESANKNREILNAYQQANAAALDRQYERMAGAKSKTKATYLEAIGSMVDKELKHKADMRTLAAYSNLFPQYGFDQNLRTFSQLPTWFQRGIVGSTQDAEEKETKKESTAKHGKNLKKHFKNGSIVKSLKNI